MFLVHSFIWLLFFGFQYSNATDWQQIMEDNRILLVRWILFTSSKDFVNKIDKGGWAPIHFAAHYNNPKICQLLIAAGADVNIADKEEIMAESPINIESTPLHLASNFNYTEICQLLIAAGADVNKVENRYEWTPLHIAAQYNNIEICRLLIAAGADVNKADKGGKTPLYFASQFHKRDMFFLPLTAIAAVDNNELCQLLIAAGADVNKAAKSGWTPLHVAAKFNNKKICRLLLATGAVVNSANNFGWTPLHSATYHLNTEICQLLLGAGANANCANKDGTTPLHSVSQFRVDEDMLTGIGNFVAGYLNAEICQLLLAAGADANKANINGLSPLQLATESMNTEIVNLLTGGARQKKKKAALGAKLFEMYEGIISSVKKYRKDKIDKALEANMLNRLHVELPLSANYLLFNLEGRYCAPLNRGRYDEDADETCAKLRQELSLLIQDL